MPVLELPTLRVQQSFLEAMAEFAVEGGADSITDDWIGRWSARWNDVPAFEEFVQELQLDRLEETRRSRSHVPSTTLWFTEGDLYLGRVSIRHRLTDQQRQVDGHIGYDVRPSARRRGHATAMLRAALSHAHDLGVDPALMACSFDNVGSIAVIGRIGGVLLDEQHGRRRYSVGTSAS